MTGASGLSDALLAPFAGLCHGSLPTHATQLTQRGTVAMESTKMSRLAIGPLIFAFLAVGILVSTGEITNPFWLIVCCGALCLIGALILSLFDSLRRT